MLSVLVPSTVENLQSAQEQVAPLGSAPFGSESSLPARTCRVHAAALTVLLNKLKALPRLRSVHLNPLLHAATCHVRSSELWRSRLLGYAASARAWCDTHGTPCLRSIPVLLSARGRVGGHYSVRFGLAARAESGL